MMLNTRQYQCRTFKHSQNGQAMLEFMIAMLVLAPIFFMIPILGKYIDIKMAQVDQWKQSVTDGANPRDIKVQLAQEIVARFHNPQASVDALADFEARFKHGAMPETMDEISLAVGEGVAITQLLKLAHLTSSTNEAVRMIEQGGVRIDGEKVTDKTRKLNQGIFVVQVGKRKFARLNLQP